MSMCACMAVEGITAVHSRVQMSQAHRDFKCSSLATLKKADI